MVIRATHAIAGKYTFTLIPLLLIYCRRDFSDENNLVIAAWTLSDHTAICSDITGVAVTCKYRSNIRYSKVAS